MATMTGRIRVLALTVALASAVPAAFAGGAADAGSQSDAGEKLTIAVSVLPQSYFAQRVAGDRAKVLVLVGPGQSPHSYEPTPRQMSELASASAWITTGVEFEIPLEPKIRSLYEKLDIVDGTRGIAFRTLEAHHHDEAEETEDDDHDEEGGRDPHVWLGRQAAKIQGAIIRDELVKLDPAGAAIYQENYAAFAAEVDATFESLKKELAPLSGQRVFVYHPSFGYLFDEFGIIQEAVETGGKEPTPKALSELIARAKEDGAKVIFVQPQFSKSAAKTVAEAIGGNVAEIDALAPDWMDNIKRIGAALAAGAR